jgi:hypothetical protein
LHATHAINTKSRGTFQCIYARISGVAFDARALTVTYAAAFLERIGSLLDISADAILATAFCPGSATLTNSIAHGIATRVLDAVARGAASVQVAKRAIGFGVV